MTSLAMLLMLQIGASQFFVSTKAGLVNFVQGDANVKPRYSLKEGEPVRTGSGSAAEILLNPGSYLRLGENSEVVLDRIELISVAVRVVSGTAIIEAAGFEEGAPLTVRSGDLEALIVDDGIYKFSDGKATVLTGKLQVAGRNYTYKKGWQVSAVTAGKVKALPTDLEVWSRKRSELLASANSSMANTLRRTSSPNMASSFFDVWLWAPSLGGFTFMPSYRYHSPYGYSYRNVNDIYNQGNSSGSGSASNSSGSFPNAGSSGSSGSSSGGSASGGSAASAPAPRQIDLSSVPSAVRMKLDPPDAK